MKQFRISTDPGALEVRVNASTRAGFLTAALEGTMALTLPLYVETDIDKRFVAPETEHPFQVAAGSFPAALVGFLNEALKLAREEEKAFVGLRLSLITDKQIEGAFLGQPVTGYGREVGEAIAAGLEVEKNELGYWEAAINFKG
jgi:hypothetical protein